MQTLPTYFAIKATPENMSHPLWAKFIKWGNQISNGVSLAGDVTNAFYGFFEGSKYFACNNFLFGSPLITLEQWESATNTTPNATPPDYLSCLRSIVDAADTGTITDLLNQINNAKHLLK